MNRRKRICSETTKTAMCHPVRGLDHRIGFSVANSHRVQLGLSQTFNYRRPLRWEGGVARQTVCGRCHPGGDHFAILNTISTKKCCPVHYGLNAKLIVIETWREHFVTRSSWLNCALQDDEAVYWVNMDTLRQ